MPSTLDDTTDYGTVTLKRTKRRPEDGSREPRWRELLKECRLLLTLENSGSVARDHLASERTFLAYARTSLTITSTGVGACISLFCKRPAAHLWVCPARAALVQLFTLSAATMNLERYARPLGASMIGIGLLTLTIGVRRYYLIQDSLIRGMYPVSRVSTSLLSFALLVVVLVVFILILASGE